MEKFEHLVIRPESTQLVLVPFQGDIDSALLRDYAPGRVDKVVAVLDELSGHGWELVAVRDGEWWLKRPAPAGGWGATT